LNPNPKLEISNLKQIQNSKIKIESCGLEFLIQDFVFVWYFDIRILDLFDISVLGFRIFSQDTP